MPADSSHALIVPLASGVGRPSSDTSPLEEFTPVPSPTNGRQTRPSSSHASAASSFDGSYPGGGSTTRKHQHPLLLTYSPTGDALHRKVADEHQVDLLTMVSIG